MGHYPWFGPSVAGANAGTQKSRDIWASGGSDDEAFFGGLATGVGTAGVEYGAQWLFKRLKNSGEVDEITRQWYDGDIQHGNTGETGRVLWSGGKNAMDAAADFATKNGLKTLEQTVTGKILTACQKVATKIVGDEKAYNLLKPLWDKASARFVQGADGTIHAFLNSQGISDTSVFMRIEYEIVKELNLNIKFHLV